MLYEPKGLPCLYVVPAANILCRVPLAPFFLHGGAVNTIPYSLRGQLGVNAAGKGLKADTKPETGQGDGSKLYQVHKWLWSYARPVQRAETIAARQARKAAALRDKERGAKLAASRRRNQATRAARMGSRPVADAGRPVETADALPVREEGSESGFSTELD